MLIKLTLPALALLLHSNILLGSQKQPSSLHENQIESLTEGHPLAKKIFKKIAKQELKSRLDEVNKSIADFTQKGGQIFYYSHNTDESKRFRIPKSSRVYPICQGGVNRSQAIYSILSKTRPDLFVEKPHGTEYGFLSKKGTSLVSEGLKGYIMDDKRPHSLFSKTFGQDRSPRFGSDLAKEICKDGLRSSSCKIERFEEHFKQNYWAKTKEHRYYIIVPKSLTHILERADPDNATIVILNLRDLVYEGFAKNPNLTDQEIDALYKKIAKDLSTMVELA